MGYVGHEPPKVHPTHHENLLLTFFNFNLLPHFLGVSKDTIFLDEFSVNLAAITVQKEATFYSTTMKAETAFAPIIRNSKQIRFLQNTYATLGEIITALLAQRKAEVTFAFDDDNSKPFFELFYLSRWGLQRCTRSLEIFAQFSRKRGCGPSCPRLQLASSLQTLAPQAPQTL